MSATIIVKPDLVREFSGADVLCIHPICQPMVDEMQAVIRFQRDQMQRAVAAMDYALTVQGDKLMAKEQFTRLTRVIAEINGQDVDAVREHYIEGSATLHKCREEEE